MTGELLEELIKGYLDKGGDGVDWPCWELNDHDAISSQGDFGEFDEDKDNYVTYLDSGSQTFLTWRSTEN